MLLYPLIMLRMDSVLTSVEFVEACLSVVRAGTVLINTAEERLRTGDVFSSVSQERLEI